VPERTLDAVVADLERRAAGLEPGARLPSVRELMASHGVSPVTVQRAVALLAARGVLEPRPGRGTYVAPRAAEVEPPDFAWQTVALGPRSVSAGGLEDLLEPPEPGVHLLGAGYLPADLQPLGALSQALARAARRPGVWDRTPLEGIPQLRGWFAAQAGGGVGEADVIVCLGGQAALAACLRGLAAPGAPVLVESPTYLGALAAARAAGLAPVPVPSDADGVRPDLLEQAFAATGARLFYCQPTYANPHGAVLAAERRAQVLEIVRDAGAFVIEDDSFHGLDLDGEPPPPLLHSDPGGHVVYVRSLTKVAAPGLRVCAVIARGPAAARLRPTRIVEGALVPGAMQEAAVELVTAPGWPRHLARVRAALRERRDALLAALRSELGVEPARPRGGMHAWVALEPEEDDVALAARAARAGVLVWPGRRYFPAEPAGPFLRITFAAEPPERLAAGVRLLARARKDMGDAQASR
jgi:DNA-binding transcriptional MocR family regulator